MKFKYTLILSGDDFIPNKLLPSITEKYQIASSFQKGDVYMDSKKTFATGMLSIWCPEKICSENSIEQYEDWYLNFIEKYYSFFKIAYVDSIEIFMEVYRVENEQCNFEIFSREKLSILSKYQVALPICIYDMTKEAYVSFNSTST